MRTLRTTATLSAFASGTVPDTKTHITTMVEVWTIDLFHLYFKQHGTELTRLLLLAEAQQRSRLRLHITDSFRRWFDGLMRVDWSRATTSSELAFRIDDAVCVLKDLSDRASRNKLAPANGNTDWL